MAFTKHKNRSDHHWQYWTNFSSTERNIGALRMPYECVLELVCDWVGAGQAYEGLTWTNSKPYERWDRCREFMCLHEDTEEFIHKLMRDIRDYGWDAVCWRVNNKIYKY
jgi:hypothetical protein